MGLDIARKATIGTIYLSSAYILSKVIDVVGTVIMIRLLLPTDYGLIVSLFSVPSVLLILSDLRLGAAATKHISEYLSTNRIGSANRVVRDYLKAKILLSAICLLSSFVLAQFLASRIFATPEIFYLFIGNIKRITDKNIASQHGCPDYRR